MFRFGNPLWKLLKGPLKKILADRFSVLGGRFKGILSSTESDLIAVLKEQFFVPGFPSHFSYADIGKRGKKAIRFDYFAVDALSGSSKLRDELAARLKNNIDLSAARTQAGINAADWDKIVQQYSEAVLSFGCLSQSRDLLMTILLLPSGILRLTWQKMNQSEL